MREDHRIVRIGRDLKLTDVLPAAPTLPSSPFDSLLLRNDKNLGLSSAIKGMQAAVTEGIDAACQGADVEQSAQIKLQAQELLKRVAHLLDMCVTKLSVLVVRERSLTQIGPVENFEEGRLQGIQELSNLVEQLTDQSTDTSSSTTTVDTSLISFFGKDPARHACAQFKTALEHAMAALQISSTDGNAAQGAQAS